MFPLLALVAIQVHQQTNFGNKNPHSSSHPPEMQIADLNFFILDNERKPGDTLKITYFYPR